MFPVFFIFFSVFFFNFLSNMPFAVIIYFLIKSVSSQNEKKKKMVSAIV